MSLHDRAVEAAHAERERSEAEEAAAVQRSKANVAQEAARVFGSAVDADSITFDAGDEWTFKCEGFTVLATDPLYDVDRGHDTYTWYWGVTSPTTVACTLASLGEAIIDGTLKVAEPAA